MIDIGITGALGLPTREVVWKGRRVMRSAHNSALQARAFSFLARILGHLRYYENKNGLIVWLRHRRAVLPASQPGFRSIGPLAYVKESKHNCFSAQGLIISRAFYLWRPRPLFYGPSTIPRLI
jgi:hypothetical protein